jgi:hypothetical protein
MTKFTDHLWSDLVAEHGPAIASAPRPAPNRVPRPRVIAAGTLALAVAGTALGLGLTSTGGGATGSTAGGTTIVTAAYTITKHGNGSVLVTINDQESVSAVNQQLNAMINDSAVVTFQSGPAPASGPLTCAPGVPGMGGPQVTMLLGTDGTQVVAPGTTGGNTGAGTWHIGSCTVYPSGYLPKGNSGKGSGIAPNSHAIRAVPKVATGTKAP